MAGKALIAMAFLLRQRVTSVQSHTAPLLNMRVTIKFRNVVVPKRSVRKDLLLIRSKIGVSF